MKGPRRPRAPPPAPLLALLLLLLAPRACHAQQSFSHSISVGRIAAGGAQTLLDRSGAGCMSFFW